MPNFRHVLADALPVEAIAIAIDENRAALRFLTRLREDEVAGAVMRPAAELLTTAQLASAFVPPSEIRQCYRSEGVDYGIFAEAVLDKRQPPYRNWWKPGVHVIFHFDPARGLQIDPKGALTFLSKRNTAELIRHLGGVWCFDMWVRNPDAPLMECSRSITTAPTTKLFTNVKDLGVPWKAADVMRGGNSKWLNLDYRLIPQTPVVQPNGWAEFLFEVLDGSTGERAADVSWDGYRIDPVDGYAPHRRFSVVNGVGRFRVMALGLNDGESLRVKVANLFQTSVAEATLRVSSDENLRPK